MREHLRNPRLLLCMLLGALLYVPTISGEFVWDDIVFLRRWAGNTDTWREILFPPPGVIGTAFYYRPITQGLATLMWKAFGATDPSLWHVTIIVIHVITIACVWYLLREWWLAPRTPNEDPAAARLRELGATAGAALYAVWPANAESVAWISSRGDTLLGPFILGAIILHLRARDRGVRPVGAAFLFLCSLLVKETGVVFLPMAVACSVLLPAAPSSVVAPDARRSFVPGRFWAPALWLPHLLVYVLYTAMRRYSMGSETGLGKVGAQMLGYMHPPLVGRAWGFYVKEALGFAGSPPFLQYPPPSAEVWHFAVLGAVLFLAATALLLKPRAWPISLAAAWFFLPLGPPLATVSAPLSQNSVAVHYLYIPNVALAALAGLALIALLRVPRVWQRRGLVLASGVVLVAVSAWSAYQRCLPWQTSIGLWERAVRDNPYSCVAGQNLGKAYWGAQRWDDTLRQLQIAAWTCTPKDSQERYSALIALAQFRITRGQHTEARAALAEARTIGGHDAVKGRAQEIEAALVVFEKVDPKQQENAQYRVPRNDLRRAVMALEHAVTLDPFASHPRITLALLYSAVGERVRAQSLYREVVAVTSSQAERDAAQAQIDRIRNEIEAETDPVRHAYESAQLAELDGRTADAIASYRAALASAPERPDLHLALADALGRSGDIAAAAVEAEEATKDDAGSAIAWLNLGIYRARGPARDVAGAADAFGRAAQLEPGWAKACANHAQALELLERFGDAAAEYERCLSVLSPMDLESRDSLHASLTRVRRKRDAAATP